MNDQTTVSPAHSVYFLKGEKSTANLLKVYQDLAQRFIDLGDFLTFESDAEWLTCYQQDSQHLKTHLPLLVFRPHSTTVLDLFINECYLQRIPVRVRCGGTSLTGASVPSPGGIILLTSHLNQILDYCPKSGRVDIEPGVTVSQLNHAIAHDGWEFPLEMATNGAAGLGACLSCHARGYHQSDRNFYGAIESVVLIDGCGERMEIPGRLLSGTEGQLGVIVQLSIQLSRIPQQRVILAAQIGWDELMDHRQVLRQYQCLKSVLWSDAQVIFKMEGESWRMAAAQDQLIKLFSQHPFQQINSIQNPFQPVGKSSFIYFSQAVPVAHLRKATAHLQILANSKGLELQFCADFLSGSLHIFLTALDKMYEFSQKVERLRRPWVEFLKTCGVDPYYGEEDWLFWGALQRLYDPHQLFLASL